MAFNKNDEKATNLEHWCITEMRFRSRGRHGNLPPPSADQLKPLFRGQSAHVLTFLLNNVRSTQTVKNVKGNLKLKSVNGKPRGENTDATDEWNVLSEKHAALLQDLNASKTSVYHVEKDLRCVKSDIESVNVRYLETTERIADCRRKTTMLAVHSQDVLSSKELYSEFTNCIRDKTALFEKRAKGMNASQMFSKEAYGTESEGGSQNLETACTKSLRESCNHIGLFLHQLLQGKFSDSTDTLARRKDTLWSVVSSTCSEYSPSQIVLSLSVYAQDSTLALREKTLNVDIRKDAEALRFKYETSGQFTDTSATPSVIETVSSLLEDAHRSNIQRFMETEKNKNSAWKLQERLEKSKQPIVSHFSRSYRGDPGALQIANALLEKETQVAVCRANLRQLHNVSEELKDRISRAMREKEILQNKYEKIQDFTKIVDQKQNLIRVLVKQNLNARTKLDAQRLKIADYVQRALGANEPETRGHSAHLKDSVSAEIEAFSTLSLPYLLFTTLDDAYKVAVIDLSINQCKSNADSICSQILRQIRELLLCPLFKAPESLSRQILSLKSEVADVEAELRREHVTWDAEHEPLIARIDDVCNQVSEHDAVQLQELLPLLKKRIFLATQALTDCLNVKDTVQHWWEQPAQGLTPWLKVDDLSYQQWCDKWTVLVTRLRQAQIK